MIAKIRTLAFTLMMACATTSAHAQNQQATEPKTKLEAFNGQSGVVLIKGYTEMGTIQATGKVSIDAMSFRNAQSGRVQSGIVIEVISTRTNRSFIDYDEIDGLLTGIEYISKADKTVTRLKNFEAIYTTKDDLKITVFNGRKNELSAAVHSGRFGGADAYLKINQLQQLKAIIEKAKEVLDASK